MVHLVKINEHGRRIGEDHPRAVLTDHEIDLLFELLAEREALIQSMQGARQAQIDLALTAAGLSYRCLGLKFEIHKRTIGKIANGDRRCQTPTTKPCP